MPVKVLVCGGRAYADLTTVVSVLDEIHRTQVISEVIEGGAKGADRLGRNWAEQRGVPCRTFPADWNRYGLSAGYKRNFQMLREGKPDLVVAFPGGKGTKNMLELTRAAGVAYITVDEKGGEVCESSRSSKTA